MSFDAKASQKKKKHIRQQPKAFQHHVGNRDLQSLSFQIICYRKLHEISKDQVAEH